MQVVINVAHDELPDKFRDLVDPDKPLKHPERLVPALRDGGFMAWLIFLFCVAIIGLMIESLVRQYLAFNAGQGYELPNLIPTLLTIPPLTWWGLRQWRLIQLGRMQAADMEKARYRRGVFFETEAALFYDGQTGTLIPRSAVENVIRKSASRESGARALGTYIVFKDANGQQHERHIPGQRAFGTASGWFKSARLPRSRPQR